MTTGTDDAAGPAATARTADPGAPSPPSGPAPAPAPAPGPKRRQRRWPWVLLALAVIGVASVILDHQWSAARRLDPPVVVVDATPEQLERGRYLTAAADCAACHTTDDGAPFAGGVALETPFGRLYGTNITPDPKYGIGQYTASEFYHAVTRGETRDGTQLFPAMPYVSFRPMTRADSDAIYAWLMSRPAVAVPNRPAELRFPYNFRTALIGWNLLFGRTRPEPASTGDSPAWQRGRYLVDVLGHCGECHTPRGSLGQIEGRLSLTGNEHLGRLVVPAITATGLAAQGFAPDSLQRYLGQGHIRNGVASDEMLKVVNLSTSQLDPTDLAAMATFLLGDRPPPPAERVAVADDAPDAPARRLYLANCAGCHGATGSGVPNVSPAMAGNLAVRAGNPRNLLVAILDGLPVHPFPGLGRMQPMPGFADAMTDDQIADLATWLRRQWGGFDATAVVVAPATVGALREPVKTAGTAGH